MKNVNITLKNMKPFNIELAKAGHPVQTRDGKPVRIICYDRKDNEYPIVALLNEDEVPWFYRKDGSSSGSSSLDLVMTTTKKEGWINIYALSSNGIIDREAEFIYDSEEAAFRQKADNACNKKYVATIKIEWEE